MRGHTSVAGKQYSLNQVLDLLNSLAKPDNVAGMARYGMSAEGRLGVSVPEMRRLAKEIGKNHDLALQLWQTAIPEARIVASLVAEPEKLTEQQMDEWVQVLDSWDVCDQVCMNLFEKSPYAWQKILEWSQRDEEFVKRAAYTLIACLAWHDKAAANDRFVQLLPIIRRGAIDERNFVKKAVNWSLRNIGKRNSYLNQAAIRIAREIQQMDSRAAKWVAGDALRELENPDIQKRFKL